MFTDTCPEEPLLESFAVGDLSIEAGDAVGSHLAECPRCEERVRQYDGAARNVVARMCAASSQQQFAAEPELLHGLAQIGTGSSTGGPNFPAAPARLDPLPDRVGEYEILDRIGQGAMGTIYKARHLRLGRVMALKLLSRAFVTEPGAARRFSREMLAAGRLSHPHIVQAADAGEIDGMLYIAMQFVDGLDLSRIAARTGQLNIADACEVVRQAAEGLECARQAGIVHRDVKPSNLILDRTGHVRLLDLGLALIHPRHGERVPELTIDGQIMGTLEYMAPEQLHDSHTVDTRADVYSLGATLYRLLTGRAPLARERRGTPLEVLQALATATPIPVEQIRTDVRRELARLIRSMLSRELDDRPQTPGAVAEALRPFTEGHDLERVMARCDAMESAGHGPPSTLTPATVMTAATLPRPQRGVAPLWRHRWRLIGLAAVAVGLLALPEVIHWASRDPAGATGVSTARAPSGGESAGAGTTAQDLNMALASQAVPESDDRSIAHWILSRGGSVTLAHEDDPTQLWVPSGPEDLPDAPFDVTDVTLVDQTLTVEDFRRLAGRPGLMSLSVVHCRIPDGGLRLLHRIPLMRLEFVDTKLSDQDVRSLGDLPNLQRLIFIECPIGDDSLAAISDRPSLRHLGLTDTRITDRGLSSLVRLQDLVTLNIDGTAVSDEGAAYLLQLPRLETLTCLNTQISREFYFDVIAPHLAESIDADQTAPPGEP